MALPGLRRIDHVGFTVPDLDEAHRSSSTCSAASTSTPSAPSARDDDWMPDHLAVHPDAGWSRTAGSACGDQAVFEVFHYSSPDQHDAIPAQQRHRRPPHRAVRRRPRRRRRAPAGRGVRRPRRTDREHAARPRATAGSTSSARGACSSSWCPTPDGKAWDRESPRRMRDDPRIHGASPCRRRPATRVAAYLREAILGGELRPGDRIRQEEVAERLGASRLPVREALRMLEAEGLTEHEPTRAPGCRGCRSTRSRSIYRMRERLEPLALVESLAQLDPDDHARLEEVQQRIEDNDDLETLPRARPRVPPAHLLRLPHRPPDVDVTPALELHPALPPRVRRARRPRPDVGRQLRAPADPRRRGAPRPGRRRAASSSGHIRRTRIELGHHPEVFGVTPYARADRERRRAVEVGERPGHRAADGAARRPRTARHPLRLRPGAVRRVLRRPRRHGGAVLRHPALAGGGSRGRHRRGAVRRRHAAPGAAGDPRPPGRAVRLLHLRDRRPRGRPARRGPDGRRRGSPRRSTATCAAAGSSAGSSTPCSRPGRIRSVVEVRGALATSSRVGG